MSLKNFLKMVNERQKSLGMTERELCKKSGLSPVAIQNIRKGHVPRATTVRALEQALDLSSGTLSALFDNIDAKAGLPGGVTLGLSDAHKVGSRSKSVPQAPLPGEIAEIDVRAGMGLGGESALEQFSPNGRDNHARDLPVGVWRMPEDYLSSEIRTNPQFARIIAVEGDSMAPTLHSGDRVLVDTRRRVPSPPGVFAIWDGMGVVVKRIELIQGSDPPTVRIISDNTMHASYERTAEEAAIIGRVVWFGRRL